MPVFAGGLTCVRTAPGRRAGRRVVGGGPAETLVFFDSFTRADSSLGGVGNSWVDSATAWQIASNQASAPAGGYSTKFLARPSGEAFTVARIRATVNQPGGASPLLWSLCDPGSANGYAAFLGSGSLNFAKITGGTLTNFTTPHPSLPSSEYDLEVTANSGYLCATVYAVGGTTPLVELGFEEATYTSGVLAVSPNGSGHTADNVTVYAGAAAYDLVCDGDSITEGSLGSGRNGWPVYCVAALGLAWRATANLGVGGQQVSDILADFSSEVAPLISGATNRCIYNMAAGTNDYYLDRAVVDVIADITSIRDLAIAAGAYRMGVSKLLYRADFPGTSTLPGDAAAQTAAHRARVDSHNTAIDTLAGSSNGFIFVVDWPSDTGMTDPTDTTYFVDLVHPTILGASLLGRSSAGRTALAA